MYTVYSKEDCSQCVMTETLLSMKHLKYEIKKLGVDYSREDLLELVPTARSFPVIFKDGVYLGGLKELKDSLK